MDRKQSIRLGRGGLRARETNRAACRSGKRYLVMCPEPRARATESRTRIRLFELLSIRENSRRPFNTLLEHSWNPCPLFGLIARN